MVAMALLVEGRGAPGPGTPSCPHVSEDTRPSWPPERLPPPEGSPDLRPHTCGWAPPPPPPPEGPGLNPGPQPVAWRTRRGSAWAQRRPRTPQPAGWRVHVASPPPPRGLGASPGALAPCQVSVVPCLRVSSEASALRVESAPQGSGGPAASGAVPTHSGGACTPSPHEAPGVVQAFSWRDHTPVSPLTQPAPCARHQGGLHPLPHPGGESQIPCSLRVTAAPWWLCREHTRSGTGPASRTRPGQLLLHTPTALPGDLPCPRVPCATPRRTRNPSAASAPVATPLPIPGPWLLPQAQQGAPDLLLIPDGPWRGRLPPPEGQGGPRGSADSAGGLGASCHGLPRAGQGWAPLAPPPHGPGLEGWRLDLASVDRSDHSCHGQGRQSWQPGRRSAPSTPAQGCVPVCRRAHECRGGIEALRPGQGPERPCHGFTQGRVTGRGPTGGGALACPLQPGRVPGSTRVWDSWACAQVLGEGCPFLPWVWAPGPPVSGPAADMPCDPVSCPGPARSRLFQEGPLPAGPTTLLQALALCLLPGGPAEGPCVLGSAWG